jgi:hypothetical protein
MFHEQIAKYTADHLRSHIEGYLVRINEQFTTPATLVVPKSIEPASVVGGMFTAFNEILPQYGIDIVGKNFDESIGDLNTFIYNGQINGMVNANSRAGVDTLALRHAAAVELFIKEHQFMHLYKTDDFSLLEVAFAGLDFSGAEEINTDDAQLWVAGFSIDLAWWTSEDAAMQHG